VSWIDKYNPEKINELSIDPFIVKKIVSYINSFPKCSKKAVLIHGSNGTGKTSAVRAVAKDMELELIEINASDTRNKESVKEIIGSASLYGSIFGRKKLIFIDEVDAVSGVKDRGGITELVNIIKSTRNPIVISADDLWSQKLSSLRYYCDIIEFKKITKLSIVEKLAKILASENKTAEKEVLEIIAKNSNGDIRSAINDLQIVCSSRQNVTLKDLESIGYREREKQIFESVQNVLQNKKLDVISSFERSGVDLRLAGMWISENIPVDYSVLETAKAYDSVSKSDVFSGRIMKRQYWRFAYYQNFFLTCGVSFSKQAEKSGWSRYSKPARLDKLWRSKSRLGKVKSIAHKLTEYTHCSARKNIGSYLPLLKTAHDSNKKFFKKIAQELNIDRLEIELFKHSGF